MGATRRGTGFGTVHLQCLLQHLHPAEPPVTLLLHNGGRGTHSPDFTRVERVPFTLPSTARTAGGRAVRSSAKEPSHRRAAEQAQQSLEFAAVACGGVELEGKSASIKSISECIHFSNASSFSSCILRCSAAGSRRQLSVAPKWRAVWHSSDKNERKEDSDEPDAPLLLDGENLSWEADVVIGREQSDQANNAADIAFNQDYGVDNKPPPRRRWIRRILFHPKQPKPATHSVRMTHHIWCAQPRNL